MLNANPKEVPLGFTLRIDRDRFDGASTLDAVGLWGAVDQAMVKELGQMTGMTPEALEQHQQSAIETGKKLIDVWRKRKN